jgi:hypothetical protein
MSKSVDFVESASAEHHVKFQIEEEELKQHHDHLEITELDQNVYSVNLGYLKVDHYYKVSFELDTMGKNEELVYLKAKSSKHLALKEMKLNEKSGLISFVFIFYAYKEKYEKENVYFCRAAQLEAEEQQDEPPFAMHICFEAKVLGVHQGTPALRSGVTLLHNNSFNTENKSHFNFI